MKTVDFVSLRQLSPFEVKDRLIAMASSRGERLMPSEPECQCDPDKANADF